METRRISFSAMDFFGFFIVLFLISLTLQEGLADIASAIRECGCPEKIEQPVPVPMEENKDPFLKQNVI